MHFRGSSGCCVSAISFAVSIGLTVGCSLLEAACAASRGEAPDGPNERSSSANAKAEDERVVELPSGLGGAGRLVAYDSGGGRLVVTRLTSSGPVELFRDPAESPRLVEVVWIDSLTVVAISERYSDSRIETLEVRWLRNGHVERASSLKRSEWSRLGDFPIRGVSLFFRGDDQIWLLLSADPDGSALEERRWLRVDDAAPHALEKNVPVGLRPGRILGRSLPTVGPPAGLNVRIARGAPAASIICSSPKRTELYAYPRIGESQLGVVEWFSTMPPLFKIEVTPNLGDDPSVPQTLYFQACEGESDVRRSDEGLWAVRNSRDSERWYVWFDGSVVAELSGYGEFEFAPR